MEWRERIDQLAAWPGWRRHGPAAGSVTVHLGLVAVIASVLGTAGASDAPRPRPPEFMELTFVPVAAVPEPEPELSAGVTPPRAPAPAPKASGETPPDPRRQKRVATATTPNPAPTSEPGGEYLPPAILLPGGAKGLDALAYGNPCEAKIGKKPKHCVDNWAARVGPMDSMTPRSKQELAEHFAEYMPTCRWKVGCEGGQWISNNGTRSVAKAPPGSADDRGQMAAMAGGAASLGGLNTIVGRLGFNPDHTDPGFGD